MDEKLKNLTNVMGNILVWAEEIDLVRLCQLFIQTAIVSKGNAAELFLMTLMIEKELQNEHGEHMQTLKEHFVQACNAMITEVPA